MKRIKVLRYKCDFCGKGSWAASRTRAHEFGCLHNPNRECECGAKAVGENLVIELQALDYDANKLLELCDCPQCVMSAIFVYRDRHPDSDYIDFDYRTERERRHDKEFPPMEF